jgi:hypothetical protein
MKPLSVFGRRSRRDLIARRASSQAIGLEQLESRVNLSAATLIPMVASVSGEGNDSQWLSPAAAPSSQQIAALTTSSAAAVAAFTAKNRVWSSSVDVVVPSLPDATSLRLQVTDGLTYWSGRQAPAFTPARANVRIDVSLGGQTVAVRASQPQPNATLALAASSTNRVAARIVVAGQPARAAAAGWYAVSAKVVAPNGGAATPVTFLFSIGRVPAGSRAAAIAAVGGVGAKPAQVSVGVTLTPPPVVAQPPVVAPITMPPMPVLPALSVSPVAPQLPAVQSTPPIVGAAAVEEIVEVSNAITSDTTWRSGTVYVITAEVHVGFRATLTIEDGVEVRIRNGRGFFFTLTSPALIFDPGSSLQAQTVFFNAANDANEVVSEANNGGVFFCGGNRNATKDDVSSRDIRYYSSFRAERIVTNYLGRPDPRGGDGKGNARDDIDAVSVIGVVSDEWNVKAVDISYSGDDGFDLTDSDIEMESVRVYNPAEDGLNLTSSSLTLNKRLQVDMTDNDAPDREIFDFEADNGQKSMISLVWRADVDLHGFWDNRRSDDWIDVYSLDMKIPLDGIRQRYDWTGRLDNGPAMIFARKRTF